MTPTKTPLSLREMLATPTTPPGLSLREMLEKRILDHPTHGSGNPETVAAMTDEELVEEFASVQWRSGQDSMTPDLW